jgi:hypothetical protein
MDEISLKFHLFYDCSKDKVIGLEDLGDETTSDKLATSAIVLMACGIIENWKQPLAYYLVNESCSSDIVKEKLTDAITKLENIGLNVLGVVSDIGSNFQKFVREMGITPSLEPLSCSCIDDGNQWWSSPRISFWYSRISVPF